VVTKPSFGIMSPCISESGQRLQLPVWVLYSVVRETGEKGSGRERQRKREGVYVCVDDRVCVFIDFLCVILYRG